jgi:hypothetical protein
MVSRPTGRVARLRPRGVWRGTRPNYVTRTQRVRLAFAMSVYGVAVVHRHGNVGHWFTGSGRESDQCDRKHCYQCFHFFPCVVQHITRAAFRWGVIGCGRARQREQFGRGGATELLLPRRGRRQQAQKVIARRRQFCTAKALHIVAHLEFALSKIFGSVRTAD